MSVVEFRSLLNVSFKPDAFPSSTCFCHHDITVCFQMRLLADLTAQPDNLSELIYGFLPHPPPRLDGYRIQQCTSQIPVSVPRIECRGLYADEPLYVEEEAML